MTYHEHTDVQYAANLRENAPEAFDALMRLNQAVMNGPDNAIPPKYTELIGVAVALTTQCAYCIESHSAAAQKAGATEQEIAETTMIGATLRAGGSFGHGLMAMKFFTQAAEQDEHA